MTLRAHPPRRTPTVIEDYYNLLKPSITFLVLITMLAGSVLAADGPLNWIIILHALIGTALASGGTAALNQYMERDVDILMRRTESRALPRHRLPARNVLIYGLAVSVIGVVYLYFTVNLLTAAVAAFTIVSYLLIYTPSKRKTWLSTIIGAVPGALPPVIGWAAVRNNLGPEAWILFAIVFFWQMPHFLAIAWMYRNDYARAGFPMLPVIDPDGARTSRHILANCAFLLAVSLIPSLVGLTGRLYLYGALAIGLGFLAFGIATAVARTNLSAKRLLLASIIYHPILLALIMLDTVKGPF